MLKKFNNPPIFSLAETKSVWITKCRPLIKFIQWFRFIQSVFILSLSCLSVIFLLYFLFQIWNNFFYRSLLHYDTKPSSLSLSLSTLTSHLLLCISSLLHLCSSELFISVVTIFWFVSVNNRLNHDEAKRCSSTLWPLCYMTPPLLLCLSPWSLCPVTSLPLCAGSLLREVCLVTSLFLCAPPSFPHLRLQTSSPPQLAGDGSSSATNLDRVLAGDSFASRQNCHGGWLENNQIRFRCELHSIFFRFSYFF